jgi:L-amino acid N-acyltransferase YncA
MIFETLSPAHATDVMRIFNYYIEHSYAAYPEKPLPVAFFAKFLEMTKDYPAFALKDANGDVVGFSFLRPYNPFPAFHHTAEVSTFIDPMHVGKGLGTEAYQRLEVGARTKGITVILAGISSKNPQSISFHRKQGFVECGRFPGIGKKNSQPFDVVWMQKTLG